MSDDRTLPQVVYDILAAADKPMSAKEIRVGIPKTLKASGLSPVLGRRTDLFRPVREPGERWGKWAIVDGAERPERSKYTPKPESNFVASTDRDVRLKKSPPRRIARQNIALSTHKRDPWYWAPTDPDHQNETVDAFVDRHMSILFGPEWKPTADQHRAKRENQPCKTKR